MTHENPLRHLSPSPLPQPGDLSVHLQVKSQLAAFGESMERDSAAQRGEVATLVQSAAERGKEFIDDTLQLSNVQASRCGLRSACQIRLTLTETIRSVGTTDMQRTAQLQDGCADGLHKIVAVTLIMTSLHVWAVWQQKHLSFSAYKFGSRDAAYTHHLHSKAVVSKYV